jgi:hypothetical protein
MSIVLVGSTSGSVTLQEPAVAGTTVLDLPATSGTILTSASAISASSITTGTLPAARLPTGSVLQVVRQNITTYASYSLGGAAIQATALTASITPTSSSSHIIVQITASIQGNGAGQGLYGEIRRGTSTTLNPTAGGGSNNYPINWICTNSLPNMGNQLATQTWLGFDSPNTTSATSYRFYVFGVNGTGNMDLNSQGSARASSVVLLWEIAG